MNSFAFSGLLVGLACTSMAVVVFLKSAKNFTNTLWAIFCLIVAIWGFGSLLIGLSKNADQSLLYWRLTYLGVTLIPPLYYHFVNVFLNKASKKDVISIYVLGLVFLITSNSSLMTAGVERRFNQIFYLLPGPIYPLFFLYFFATVLIAHIYLWQYMRNTDDTHKKVQVSWIFLASAIGFTGGLLCFLPVFGIEIYPYGNFAVGLYPIIMTHAVIKHNLFDIRIVIKKAIFYSTLTILVSILYVVVFIFHSFYSNESIKSLGVSAVKIRTDFNEHFKLTPYFYSLALTTISSFVLSVFVFLKAKKNRANILWSLGALFCGIWSLFFNILIHSKDENIALLSAQICNIAAGFVCIFLCHFCKEFSAHKPNKNILIILGYVNAIIFMCFGFSKHFLFVKPFLGFTFYTQPYSLYYFFTVHFFFYLIYGHWCLARSLSNHTDPKRNQIKYIIFALSLGYVAGITTFLPVFGVPVEPFPVHFVWFYAAIIAYAMVKHELLDIRIIIKKAALFSLFTIFLSVLSLALVLITHSLVAETKSPLSSFVANFIGILFIAIMFKPLEIFFQKKLEKRFFKGSVSEIAEQNEKLAAELERRERLKSVGILAAGMAHEIKNPLSAIKTFAEFLPQRYAEASFREKFIKIVNSETDRISNIVKDLLLFSKPAAPKKQVVDCGEVLRSTILLLSEDMTKRNIKVHYEIAPDQKLAFVDPSQIKQAALNILLNAIDAIGAGGGTITVGVKPHNEQVKIIISDTGPGIPEDKLKHLFDPFYTTKDDGTGLGLAITHTLVVSNNGRITAENQPTGGAQFSIFLPLAPTK